MDDTTPGSGTPDDDLTGEKLTELVEEMEQRVEAERDEEGVPGSKSDRDATEAMKPDDQAPE